jgi:ribonuclease D
VIDHLELLRGDLTDEAFSALSRADRVAWDIETSGLDWATERIGTCQLHSVETGTIVIQVYGDASPKRLRELLADTQVLKVFHHAPFDLRFMTAHWSVEPANVACTKLVQCLTFSLPPC